MNSNVKNGFFCCQEAMKVMYEQGFGAICNMSGEAAFYPMEYCLLQATAKGAIYHMTQTLALEAAPHNVRVNCVSAGIGAGAPGQFGLGWKNPADRARPDAYEFDARNVVTKRQRGPEEVADTFVYLCSDLAVGISGQLVFVNGGGFYSLLVKPRSPQSDTPARS
jgi:NAD(P)-dependent dehydrogenase (short-subunit alcohol dehydrogenase family)